MILVAGIPDERPVALGLIGSQAALEVYASPGGSWTILITDLSGRTCIMASGNSLVMDPLPPPGTSAMKALAGG